MNSVKDMIISTTTFVGRHYEVTGSTVTKYYFAGTQRVAMRKGSTLSYLLGDHLGSTSITTNSSGALVSELRYKPWGETRYSSGTTPTKYQFTGQYSYQSDFGLLFYNARWYDSLTGRFAQADSIVPGGVQGLDRYAYVNNSPINYIDPSGHVCEDPEKKDGVCFGSSLEQTKINNKMVRGNNAELGKAKNSSPDKSYIDLLLGLHPNSCSINSCTPNTLIASAGAHTTTEKSFTACFSGINCAINLPGYKKVNVDVGILYVESDVNVNYTYINNESAITFSNQGASSGNFDLLPWDETVYSVDIISASIDIDKAEGSYSMGLGVTNAASVVSVVNASYNINTSDFSGGGEINTTMGIRPLIPAFAWALATYGPSIFQQIPTIPVAP